MTRFKNWGPGLNLLIYLTLGLALGSLVWSPKLQAQSWGHPKIIPIARPNPQDRGNCYQWKGCKGESIGAMPVDNPEFCGPLGGKSWK
ncbi:MAG: hypothetical protein LBR11_04620, partial [Deltaproteobacteria bacterium]|nr:hypothetical protein [Deltaproteobacteria bacterium]